LPNRFRIEQEPRIVQARFLFPKGALNFGESFPPLNFRRVRECRRTRIRVHRRTVADDQ
jgi:hypothetical protein